MGKSTFSGPVAGAYDVIQLAVPGTLVVGDGAAKWIAPYDCRLVHVGAWLKDTGATSGNTQLQVSSAATDFLATTLDIAYNDADGVAETTNLANQNISRGDVVEIDIDTIPTGASADLTVHLTVYVKGHTVNT